MSASAAPAPVLTPEIADLQAQFAAIRAEASDLVKGLSEAQFNWRPSPPSWSISECLQHLNMAGERYTRLLEAVLNDPRMRTRSGPGPFRHGWIGKWIIGLTEPPPKHRYRAPRSFRPVYGQPFTAVMPTFLHLQDHLSRLAGQANGLDLGRIKAPTPCLGPIKVNLYVTFSWIAAHERRHMWQARQIRSHSAYPAQLTGRGY